MFCVLFAQGPPQRRTPDLTLSVLVLLFRSGGRVWKRNASHNFEGGARIRKSHDLVGAGPLYSGHFGTPIPKQCRHRYCGNGTSALLGSTVFTDSDTPRLRAAALSRSFSIPPFEKLLGDSYQNIYNPSYSLWR